MVLEPLRKEALTDVDAERRDNRLSSHEQSQTNTDAQSEAAPDGWRYHRRTARTDNATRSVLETTSGFYTR